MAARSRPRNRERRSAKAAPVRVAWKVRRRPLSDPAVRRAVRAALAFGGRPQLSIEVALISDPALARLHDRFLGDPAPTDVMSFDLEDERGGVGGEIYVSVDRARRVARERGVDAARELTLYLVHGALHLCGLDDHAPAARRRMRAAEARVMAQLGHAPDPGAHE